MSPPTSTDTEAPPAGALSSDQTNQTSPTGPDPRAARAELAALRQARRAEVDQPPLPARPQRASLVPFRRVRRSRVSGSDRADLHDHVEPDEGSVDPVPDNHVAGATQAAPEMVHGSPAVPNEVASATVRPPEVAQKRIPSGAPVAGVGAGTGPIDPRFEARRIEVARDERRRRRLRILGLIMVLAVIGAGFGVTRTPALDVDHIAITGWSHDQRADILAASGITIGTQLTDIDPAAAARRIEALVPWVAAARVTRTWPGSVLITVVERRPVARVLTDRGSWMVLDGAGHLLEEASTPQPELITVEGTSPGAVPGAVLTPAGAKGVGVLAQMSPSLLSRIHALRFVHRSGPAPAPSPEDPTGAATPAIALVDAALVSDVSAARVSAEPEVELVLAPTGSVAFGPPEQVQMKLLALETVLARVDLTCLEAIDVRVPRRPLVKRNAECEAQLAG